MSFGDFAFVLFGLIGWLAFFMAQMRLRATQDELQRWRDAGTSFLAG